MHHHSAFQLSIFLLLSKRTQSTQNKTTTVVNNNKNAISLTEESQAKDFWKK